MRIFHGFAILGRLRSAQGRYCMTPAFFMTPVFEELL